MATQVYEIRTRGDWCNGYYWEIVPVGGWNPVKESRSEYHGESGRRWAFDDAIDYADRNGLALKSTANPH